MQKDIQQIKQLLLIDPETGDQLTISSDIVKHENGSYSFCTLNKATGHQWRHTIGTKEV
jgi:hypothetical protein